MLESIGDKPLRDCWRFGGRSFIKWMNAQPFPQFPKIFLLSMRKPRRQKG
jgi:hypothetical protein